MQAGSGVVSGGTGQKINARHAGDGGQGLAPEAQRCDGGQIVGAADLAGGVTEKRGFRIVRRHAAAVVRDADERHAPVLDFYGDVLCTGVHGIFQQFFDDAAGAFHHFSGSDQIRHMGR